MQLHLHPPHVSAHARSERFDAAASLLRDAFWVFALGVVCCFAFFVALGALHPGQVAGLSIAMGVLVVLWCAHAYLRSRAREERDPRVVRARERRGF